MLVVNSTRAASRRLSRTWGRAHLPGVSLETRRAERLLSVLLLGATLGLSSPALGDAGPAPRNLYLEEGKRQISRGRPEAAVDELQRALDMPGVPETQRIEILSWLGAALHLAGDEIEAERVWETRVRADPRSAPPLDLPQEVIEAFDLVRDRTVIISHSPPAEVFAGLPLELEAALVDRMDRTSDLLVYTRRAGEAGYQVATFGRREGSWKAAVVPPPLAGTATQYDLEYYLVAQADTGEVLHSLGDAGSPMKLIAGRAPAGREVDARYTVVTAPREAVSANTVPSRDSGTRSRGWIWGTVLGACILAAAGTVYVMMSADSGAELPATSLGTISFPLGSEEER